MEKKKNNEKSNQKIQKGIRATIVSCARNSYTGVIGKDGSLWMFGSNAYGQLGDGTYRKKNTPLKISDDFKGGVAR